MQDKKMVEVYKKTIVDRLYSETMRQFVFVFFLASAFTYGFMYRIIDCRTAIWVIIPLVLYLIFDPRNTKSPFDYSLLILSAIYFLIGVFQYFSNPYLNYIYDPTVYAWTAPIVYLLGKLIIGKSKEHINEKAHLVLIILGIGMFLQACLDFGHQFYYEFSHGYVHTFIFNSFWGAVYANRNLFDYGFMIVLASLPYAIIIRKKKRGFLYLSIILTVTSIVISLMDWGRTVLASTILVLAAEFIIYFFSNNKLISTKLKKRIVFLTSLLLAIAVLLYIVMVNDIFGLGTITGWRKALIRDGGLLNNVRLSYIKEGLVNIFTLQKGGWNIDFGTTHCTWTEMGRNYDIIVFLLWCVFLVISWFDTLCLVVKHNKKFPVAYFAFGSLLLLFFFCCTEENPFVYKDLLLIYIFVYGLISGVKNVAELPDYGVLNGKSVTNTRRYIFMGMGLLIFALFSACYLEWWSDVARVYMTFVIPVLVFFVAGMFLNNKWQLIAIASVASLATILGIYMLAISVKSEYYPAGYYIEPFTNIVVEKSVFYGLWIIPISVVVGGVLHWFKVNKWIAAVVVTVVTGILSYGQITDGRLHMLKEAVKLQLNMEKNMRWMLSKENYEGIITSHNMYMDFARDYGVITFGLIIAFEIWAIICFIKMLMNSNKTMVEYVLIVAFVLFNYHFMFESTAFASRYIFAIAMFVYGMIANSVTRTDKEYEGKWNILIRR